jgi:hypothetical protein
MSAIAQQNSTKTTPAAPKNQKTQHSLGIKTFLSLSLVLCKKQYIVASCMV